jgi:diacylglycerol kinase
MKKTIDVIWGLLFLSMFPVAVLALWVDKSEIYLKILGTQILLILLGTIISSAIEKVK